MQNSDSNDDRPTRVSGSPNNPPNRPANSGLGGLSDGDDRATRVSSGSGFGGVVGGGNSPFGGGNSPFGGGNSPFGGFNEPVDMGERNKGTIVRGAASEIEQVAWLYCRKGLRKGQLYQFRKKRNELGRAADCDVFIEDPYVGSRHGAVMLEENEWKIFDFASVNGTKVNNKRLGGEASNPITLTDGDVIEIGDTELVFKRI